MSELSLCPSIKLLLRNLKPRDKAKDSRTGKDQASLWPDAQSPVLFFPPLQAVSCLFFFPQLTQLQLVHNLFSTESLTFTNNAVSNTFGTPLLLFQRVERKSLPLLDTTTNTHIKHSCQISNPICSIMCTRHVHGFETRSRINCEWDTLPEN